MLKALGYREARPNNDPSKVENVFFGVKGVKNNSTRKNARPGTLNTLKGWFGFATPGTTTPVSEAPTEVAEEAVSVISNNNNRNGNNRNTIMVNEMAEQNAIPAEMPLNASFNTGIAAVPSANIPKRRGFITNAELRAARAAHTNNTGFGRRLFNNTLRTSGGKRSYKRSYKRRSYKRRSHKRRSNKTKNRRTNRK